MRFKRLALLFIVGCAVFCANAVSVAFQIVQHGDSEIRSSSYVIEEGLFDFFFGKGIIISNSPAIASDGVENDASFFEKSRQEAWEGGVDYFVELTADFSSSNSTNPDADLLANLSSLSYKVLNVGSGTVLGSGKKIPPASSQFKDKRKGLSDFAFGIADDIYKIIRR